MVNAFSDLGRDWTFLDVLRFSGRGASEVSGNRLNARRFEGGGRGLRHINHFTTVEGWVASAAYPTVVSSIFQERVAASTALTKAR